VTGTVIDSTVLAKYLLKEEGWEQVRSILISKQYTVSLAVKEAANAIWKRAILLKDINSGQATELLRDLNDISRMLIRVETQRQYLVEAMRIALKHRIPIYDSLFIAQAKSKGAALVTSDKRQYAIALKEGIPARLV
jgi:predicted nucleic acid-binding protein